MSCEYVMDVGRVWHLLLPPAAVAAAEPSAAAAEVLLSRSRRRAAAAPASGLVAWWKGIILAGRGVNELRAPVLRRRACGGIRQAKRRHRWLGGCCWTDLILWLPRHDG